ncbi:MAG: tetratricopeptide repeat protein [Acidobacteriota bacterium]
MKNSAMRIWMLLVFSVLAAQAFGQVEPAVAPEGIPVESDWLYRQHYAQVQEIMKLPLAQRVAALEGFRNKVDRKAKVYQYMSGFFGEVLRAYKAAGKTAEADKLQAKMYQLFPELKPSPAAEMQKAFQSKDYRKAIQVGEQLYAESRDKQAVFVLAQSYISTKDGPKAAEYSRKAVQSMGAKDGIYFLTWLAEYSVSQRDSAKALQYYEQMFRAYPDTVPPNWNAAQWSQTLSKGYLLKARTQYGRKDYKGAIDSYYKSLKLIPKNASAYLAIGLSHWRQKEHTEALGALALATVLDTPGATKARQSLEQLYKAMNKTLDGLDNLLNEARSKVGS